VRRTSAWPTDHVIESFRNHLWADYKTGDGIEPALWAQFHPLEEALAAMGVVVWAMIELEADDALASAAHIAAADKRVEKVCIWTPDKDLAQCVDGDRVVQIDGRRKIIRNAVGVREKFGVEPRLIPDFLALVGDTADGYPGIPGIVAVTAARLLNQHGAIETFPLPCWATSVKTRCALRNWRRSGPTPRCFRTSTSCAGADQRRSSPRGRKRSEPLGCSSAAARRRYLGYRRPGRAYPHSDSPPLPLPEPQHAERAARHVAEQDRRPDVRGTERPQRPE